MKKRNQLGLILILANLLGSGHAYSQTPSHGGWISSDGSAVSMECPIEYKGITRLPSGCVNMLTGGGLLWTPDSYSKNEADLKRASVMIGELKLNLSDLRKSIVKMSKDHSDRVSNIKAEALSEIRAIEGAHGESIFRSFCYGAASGIALSLIIAITI